MHIQPIDISSLLRAVAWPLITIITLVIFRRPMASLISTLGQKVSKFSFGKFSIEMAQVAEMKPQAMDTEIRQLEAGLTPQSGSTALTALVNELQSGGKHDYVVIDFGSEQSPRWLTSRLYLLCFLITLINRQLCVVFVETVIGVRRKFIGISSPVAVRWALADKYPWLESAGANAYWGQVNNPPVGFLNPVNGFLWTMIPNLMQQFLNIVRQSVAPPEREKSGWVSLDKQQTFEHAKWMNGDLIESILGTEVSMAHVTLLPNATLNDLARPILAQQGRFVAVVDQNQILLSVVDRYEVMEDMAREVESNRSNQA
jgi:hypothetical protein